MEVSELKRMVARQEELGLDSLVLKMPEPKSWRKNPPTSYKVRSPFGLCNWGGYGYDGNIVIWPSLKQVKAYIYKAEREMFWGVAIDEKKLCAYLVHTNLLGQEELEKNELGIRITRRFPTKKEAEACLLWAASRTEGVEVVTVKNDPAP